ncbi:MAG TPA: SPOR domain-containing protein [Phycisphaerae bacterium]|nr:SPOR domain-containing protein [Phycisphaerae bacterium]
MRVRVCTALSALLLVSCGPTEADKKVLSDAYVSYASRDFAGTENLAGTYIQKEPTAENVDEAFYLRGLARYGRGDRAGAAADLQKAIEHTKRADLKCKAYMTLGDIAFDEGKWDEAAANYQKALGAGVAAGTVEPRMEFRLGVALQAIGQWDHARPHLAIAAASKDAALAQRARERLEAAAFTLQFGAFTQGARAGELQRRLKAAGIVASANSEMHNGQVVFVVRAGNYTTLADAELARRKLAAKWPGVVVIP